MSRHDRLSPLDSSFLYMESPTAHMHVGALSYFEDPGLSEDEICRHIESRLHLVPRYRQRLAWVPFQQGRPVWVDDPHFDIKNHVIFAGVPKPGSERDVLRLTARLLSRPLDRGRPLWEMWLVYMKDGRIAMISKSHHCLVDGISAVDIGTAIMDLSKDAVTVEAEPWRPESEPTERELFTAALWERMTQPREMLRSLRAATRTPRSVVQRGAELTRALLSSAQASFDMAPRTSFTKPIGPHRRFEVVRGDLSLVKAVKNHFGCTVNDVVLTVVAGAVRRLLESRKERVDGLTLRAMVPVSVRTNDQRYTYGNKVSWVIADLPIGVPHAEGRLRAVRDSMEYLKRSRQAVSAEFWFKLSEYAPPTVLSLAGRAMAFQRLTNLIVTNIPGPQFPLFFRGGEMQEAFPVVPIMGIASLGIAILSYNGNVNFGINADYGLFPDLEVLARGVSESLGELSEFVKAERAA